MSGPVWSRDVPCPWCLRVHPWVRYGALPTTPEVSETDHRRLTHISSCPGTGLPLLLNLQSDPRIRP